MSEDSDYMCVSGHDERWSADVGTQTDFDESNEVAGLKEKIRLCQRHLVHCEWHFMAYREAIQQIPSGVERFQQVIKEFEDSDEPRCRACELDSLLNEIADLKRFKANQIATGIRARKESSSSSSTFNRKRKLSADDTGEPKNN